MNRLLFFLLLVSLLSPVLAQENLGIADQQSGDTTNYNEQATLLAINGKLNTLPSEQDMDSSFQQLELSFRQSISSAFSNSVAFMVMVVFVNDILILVAYFILKARGWV